MDKIYDEKISITVYGTDIKGDMFVEDTSTLTLARGWVKLMLRRKAPLGSEVIIYNKANGSQAEFVLQSQDGSVMTAELKDYDAQIWDRDFGGPAAPVPDNRERVHMVCKACGTQESVPMEPKDKAKALAGDILWRHCAQCVDETDWQAEVVILAQRATKSAAVAPAVAAPPLPPPPAPAAPVELPSILRPAAAPLPAVAAVTAPPPPPPPPAAPEPAPAAPINWADRRSSRRIQMKTRARVRRQNDMTEVVAPLNVSKGGVGFESRLSYSLDEIVFVALHYREGGEALETSGTIVRVSKRSGAFEYGVRYEQ